MTDSNSSEFFSVESEGSSESESYDLRAIAEENSDFYYLSDDSFENSSDYISDDSLESSNNNNDQIIHPHYIDTYIPGRAIPLNEPDPVLLVEEYIQRREERRQNRINEARESLKAEITLATSIIISLNLLLIGVFIAIIILDIISGIQYLTTWLEIFISTIVFTKFLFHLSITIISCNMDPYKFLKFFSPSKSYNHYKAIIYFSEFAMNIMMIIGISYSENFRKLFIDFFVAQDLYTPINVLGFLFIFFYGLYWFFSFVWFILAVINWIFFYFIKRSNLLYDTVRVYILFLVYN